MSADLRYRASTVATGLTPSEIPATAVAHPEAIATRGTGKMTEPLQSYFFAMAGYAFGGNRRST
jgi:hypothetical protein